MSLPSAFSSAESYFIEVLDYLEKCSWLVSYSNTRFLRAGVLSEMPESFQEYFQNISLEDLNSFPNLQEHLSSRLPEELELFRKNAIRLTPKMSIAEIIDEGRGGREEKKKHSTCNLHMKPKKQHEVQRLSEKIIKILFQEEEEEEEEESKRKSNDVKKKPGIHPLIRRDKGTVFIDLGAGLGYHLHQRILDLLPIDFTNCWILALEANAELVRKAQERHESVKEKKRIIIINREHKIEENNSKTFIEQCLLDHHDERDEERRVPPQCWTMIGLHACGDLTVTSLRLFLEMDNVRYLIVVPCCYHKLQMKDVNGEEEEVEEDSLFKGFRNFPLCRILRETLRRKNEKEVEGETICQFLNRPFMRLACQETSRRWNRWTGMEHQIHGQRMFQRSMADAIIDEKLESIRIKKMSRGKKDTNTIKETNLMMMENVKDISSYQKTLKLDAWEMFRENYEILEKKTGETMSWNEKHREKYVNLWEKYSESGVKLAEGITCLQTTIQQLCENIVLYDRLCFLEETAQERNLPIQARYERIFEESLSPRCQVLIVEKLK